MGVHCRAGRVVGRPGRARGAGPVVAGASTAVVVPVAVAIPVAVVVPVAVVHPVAVVVPIDVVDSGVLDAEAVAHSDRPAWQARRVRAAVPRGGPVLGVPPQDVADC